MGEAKRKREAQKRKSAADDSTFMRLRVLAADDALTEQMAGDDLLTRLVSELFQRLPDDGAPCLNPDCGAPVKSDTLGAIVVLEPYDRTKVDVAHAAILCAKCTAAVATSSISTTSIAQWIGQLAGRPHKRRLGSISEIERNRGNA
jgi:hypothetical protein